MMSNPLSSTIDVHTSTIKGTHSDCVDCENKTKKKRLLMERNRAECFSTWSSPTNYLGPLTYYYYDQMTYMRAYKKKKYVGVAKKLKFNNGGLVLGNKKSLRNTAFEHNNYLHWTKMILARKVLPADKVPEVCRSRFPVVAVRWA